MKIKNEIRGGQETILEESSVVGRSKIEAENYLKSVGWNLFVFEGEPEFYHYDCVFDRIRLSIKNGVVSEYDFG